MKKLLLFAAAALCSISAQSQILKPITWSYASKKINKSEAIVYIKATIDEGWHIYSQNLKSGGPVKTTFKFPASTSYKLIGITTEPKAISTYEDTFKMQVSYFENSVIFQQKIKLLSPKATIKGTIEYMTCNNQQCLPPDEVAFSIHIK